MKKIGEHLTIKEAAKMIGVSEEKSEILLEEIVMESVKTSEELTKQYLGISFNAESVAAFQNIVAYLSGDTKTLTVEFRAEVFTEPHSKYMVLLHNQKEDIECVPLGDSGIFQKGFLEKIQLSDGRVFNAVKIGRSEATSPKFPFKVEIRAKGDQPIQFGGAMKADSVDSYICIQCKGSYDS